MNFQEKKKEWGREYWESRLPQARLASAEPGTQEYEQQVSSIRYRRHAYIQKFFDSSLFAGKQLLEVGCGIGTDLLHFKKNGVEVTGIDITQSSIDICKKRSAFYKFNIPLYRMSAEKLEFPDQNFDIVYSFGVLHHLPNTENAIHEINRVLKKGGVAIIRVNAKGWWYYGRILFWQGFLQGRLFKMSKQEVINKNTLVEGESPLVKFFNRKEVKQLFVDFKIQRIRKYYLGANFCFLPYWLREEVLGRLFGNHWMIEVRN